MTEGDDVRIPSEAEAARTQADAFLAEYWAQVAGAAWRYYRKQGRGAVVLPWAAVQGFSEGKEFVFEVLYLRDIGPEGLRELIQAYDPQTSIAAVFMEPSDFAALKPGEGRAFGALAGWIFSRSLSPPIADVNPSPEEAEWALKQAAEFTERLDQRLPLVTTLVDDVRIAHERIERSSQADRRSYVRTVFALVEGLTSCMKQTLLDSHELLGVRLSAGELSLLRERRYGLDDKGRIKTARHDQPIGDNYRFAVRMLHRIYGARLEIDYGGQPWQHFRAAIDIRNRLTHPKSPESCIVSDPDFESIEWAVGLFKGASVAFFQAIHTVFKVKGQQIAADLVRRRRGREDVGFDAKGDPDSE